MRKRRSVLWEGLWVGGGLAAASLGCLSGTSVRGEPIGTFSFVASPVTATDPDVAPGVCELTDVVEGAFDFEATFSRDSQTGEVFATVGGQDRSARLVGQVLTSEHEAPRTFNDCSCSGVTLHETLQVALLTSAQVATPNCPPFVLDGGLPEVDGGVVGEDGHFQPVRACGLLVDEVRVPDAGCSCQPCTLKYKVNGGRS